VTFQRSAPRKTERWLALAAVVGLLSTFVVSSVMAVTFNFVPDDQGANDEPGQKDLTAQASAFDSGSFFTAWKWDDTSWSGKNTGDACSLFDTDANGLVDYAICVTVATKNATEQSTRVYSCKDTRSDRCTGAVLEGTEGVDSSASWCSVASAGGEFDATDTQATCNASLVDSDLAGVSGLDNATLLNSCSYPSQEPNSDPSDCVLTITNVDVSVGTQSGGSITWSATLTDTATLTPSGATGSVTFDLYSDATCTAANLVATSTDSDGTNGFTASQTVTNATADAGSDGKFYWIATYTPTGAFNGDSSACGEETTVVATVTGSSGN